MVDIIGKKNRATIVVIIDWILFSAGLICVGLLLIFYETMVKHLTDIAHKKRMDNALASWQLLGTAQQEDAPQKLQIASEQVWTEQDKIARKLVTIYIIIAVVGLLIKLTFNILLTKGVRQEDHVKCNCWFWLSFIFFVADFMYLIVKFVQLLMGTITFLAILPDLIFLLWLGLSLYLVRDFIKTLGEESEEMSKFKEGSCLGIICLSCMECC